jgi:hypothetical protein
MFLGESKQGLLESAANFTYISFLMIKKHFLTMIEALIFMCPYLELIQFLFLLN